MLLPVSQADIKYKLYIQGRASHPEALPIGEQMGDMADALTEEGMDAVLLHNIGQCDAFCRYCDEDAEWKDREEGNE